MDDIKLKCLHLFTKLNSHCYYIEIKRLDIKTDDLSKLYYWFYLDENELIRLTFKSSDMTTQGKNIRVLKCNDENSYIQPIHILYFDDKEMIGPDGYFTYIRINSNKLPIEIKNKIISFIFRTE
uniref:Uncharacterized protein n=1 Tax=Pithovirus LCPAC001 TaxID=2506585 RepID=A0A481Z292_9VIRU|nr:MAG: hypothetical protein LCPAC001_00640 [Pithovirus LCPAC001]